MRMTRDQRWVWFGLFAGPVAWSIDHVVSYSLAVRVSDSQDKTWLYLSTVATAAVVVAGAMLALRALRSRETERSTWRFLATMALAMNGFFLLAIGANALGKVIHHPRD